LVNRVTGYLSAAALTATQRRSPVPKTALLKHVAPKPLPYPRNTSSVEAELRALLAGGQLELPPPATGRTAERWTALAELGRRDLSLARLAEGHADAVAILTEARRSPVPGALYGVWAARSGGTGADLLNPGDARRLSGTVRFCSGAHVLDRALVAAVTPGETGAAGVLIDVDLADPRVHRSQDTWQAIGMDASDSADVTFDELPVRPAMVVGDPGWYVSRPGFAHGGIGVAAVWLGGCAAVLDSVLALLGERGQADGHQLAHLGAMHTAIRSAEALLTLAAADVDAAPDQDATRLVQVCRAAVEGAAGEILDRAPKVTGPGPLCRDRRFPQQLADLQVYVRQHHAERDLAALGAGLLETDGRP
jgi:alkylation response protein AidB-like acyl-CoA dehydrogenase